MPPIDVLPRDNAFGCIQNRGPLLAQRSEVATLTERLFYRGTIPGSSDNRVAHSLEKCLEWE